MNDIMMGRLGAQLQLEGAARSEDDAVESEYSYDHSNDRHADICL